MTEHSDHIKMLLAGAEADRITAEALTDVNKLRVAFGFAPLDAMPAGIVHDATWCPIAHSLRPCGGAFKGLEVLDNEIEFATVEASERAAYELDTGNNPDDYFRAKMTPALALFRSKFDAHELPELIEEYTSRDLSTYDW